MTALRGPLRPKFPPSVVFEDFYSTILQREVSGINQFNSVIDDVLSQKTQIIRLK